ncbi:MAG: OsmC family protein [Thermoplasmata archaeon]
MCAEEAGISIELRQQEKYRFLVDFGLPKARPLEVDEDPPLGGNSGPDPSRLLAAAAAHCMASSLLFCLEKSRIDVRDLNVIAKAYFGRNEENRLRITRIELQLNVKVPDSEKASAERCKTIFDKYCTVSQSIKRGIPIDFKIDFN